MASRSRAALVRHDGHEERAVYEGRSGFPAREALSWEDAGRERWVWDSNPREACTPSGFQDRRTRPLCEPTWLRFCHASGRLSCLVRDWAANWGVGALGESAARPSFSCPSASRATAIRALEISTVPVEMAGGPGITAPAHRPASIRALE